MADNLPILVIITSADCPACQNLHASGSFNRDGPPNPRLSFYGVKWEAPSFWPLISGDPEPTAQSRPRFRVYEIEVFSMRNTGHNNIKSYTEFVLSSDGMGITRHTYFRSAEGGDGIIYVENEGNITEGVKKDGSFTAMVARLFPNGIRSLVIQFPSFMWVSRVEWKKGLDDSNYVPYAAVFGLVVGEKTTGKGKVYGIVSQDTSDKRKTIVQMANLISTNPAVLIHTPLVQSEAKTPLPSTGGQGQVDVASSSKGEDKTFKKVAPRAEGVCNIPKVRVVPLSTFPGYYR